ncbi:Gp49 family protein [Xanthomonas sp. NCPPB 1325]|uniref:Gp49 family protein n=1 Tax=Xanthomonas sp. NCPPB 1325 TaxID=487529 RepID=UPI0035566418
MTDQAIEQEIQAKGLTASRVTPEDIEAEISAEYTFVVGDVLNQAPIVESVKLLTICVIVLRNGFTVTGESACASRENFDADIGRKIARQNAVAKIWPLLGFRLRDKLAG